MFETPIIAEPIKGIAPDFRALSIHVDAKGAKEGSFDSSVLTTACEVVSAGGPSWADAHLASWSDAYQRFGAKPNRTPCSAQALRKRVIKDGRIPAINPVVDLYNAVSLRYALPVGGENFDAYVGRPHLTVADGTEIFDTVMNGEAVLEHPAPGEVIWRDDLGVTCRRWNWRQGTRTRLETAAGRMWFILEALGTMPENALDEAGDMLVQGLSQLMPGCEIQRQRVSVI
ncbi:B3/B4 domain-containing protein [Microvirga splendida]|uniref:B3/4 domain-containing protein n=1 Tax=Microvirga splendida TaxID=2795727 RepID=A0ABS0Y879_9HYPH|nr:B3/4 domain-containing protein [Microvirga splendida]MBJ6128516.1 B3/4 domain-containing protein [Microvirga splendida]